MPRFAFDFEGKFRPLVLAAAGATPSNSEVVVEDGRFIARFGRYTVDTPVTNIRKTETSGPYRWYRAIGPRGSFSDGGATFGSTTRGGVCLTFTEPVTALAGRLMPHPGLTVTVADPDGLVAAIEAARD